MSKLTPKRNPYYSYLLSSEDNDEIRPKQGDFVVAGCSINTFGQMAKVGREPSRGVHEAWCATFKGKARRLNELYHWVWGSADPDESLEASTVFSGITAELLQAECESVRRRKAGVSLLDKRFALEQLTTLSEIKKDWQGANELMAEMLILQQKMGDSIYLGRAHVRKAYIAYKLFRTSGGKLAGLGDVETELERAEKAWAVLVGSEWRKNHPDVKAYVKCLEIRALVLCRRSEYRRAVESIVDAQVLRNKFSGAAGKASGAYREAVIYSEAAAHDESFAPKARTAFARCIKLRAELDLPGDAGIAAERWAQFERAEFEAGRSRAHHWLEALKAAFKYFGEANDPVRQLRIALEAVEHDKEAFRTSGSQMMLQTVPKAFVAAFWRGAWEAFRAQLDHPGWQTWVGCHEAGRVVLDRALMGVAPASQKRGIKHSWEARARETREIFGKLANDSGGKQAQESEA